ncbi:ribosome small subunit-dependent GTPase A [Alicyclobacillus sp. SO9]|uniref:ribosome small subunit-dependent GTPase A n=1 Tax=Alicyclobacillus sp. SO9 TaxID=2665646 RepID=UPI0018E8325F|nr:ribosome small subunit-dependent GTPase A [Alicyclobacillus sp. SO9]QQE80742.1 ribosome small subunit-dependent GTPase A [Alicyclobacillus sp. SO9]
MKGTVVRAFGGFFAVDSEEGTVECKARGVFRKQKVSILVGDVVEWDAVSSTDGVVTEGLITKVEPRQTHLIRPPIANCNQAVLVFSALSPDFHSHLLDCTLISAEAEGLRTAIVLSKVDLISDEQATKLVEPYVQAGYKVVFVGSQDGTGVAKVRALLQGKISVFAGPSGAGKSSLANRIAPELGLKMGKISDKSRRGKHTTTHVELFRLENETYVADAPGFSQINVELPSEELRTYFPEFMLVSNDCEYRGCLHIDEENCAVKEAVQSGRIASKRYESYRTLYEHVRLKEERKY